jgi:hypothetical protein
MKCTLLHTYDAVCADTYTFLWTQVQVSLCTFLWAQLAAVHALRIWAKTQFPCYTVVVLINATRDALSQDDDVAKFDWQLRTDIWRTKRSPCVFADIPWTRLLPSRIQCRVVRWKSTDVSEEHFTFIPMVKEHDKQETIMKQVRKDLSTPSSGSKSMLRLLPASCWFLAWLILLPWRWRRHVPQKRRLTFSGLHCIITEKIKLFIATAVRTSNRERPELPCIMGKAWNARIVLQDFYVMRELFEAF